ERHVAQKCTLCYDRLRSGLVPACAQACPTQSIQFGTITDLQRRARSRLAQLKGQGVSKARLYGADEDVLGGLNSFYLLVDEPEVSGLPSSPKVPSRAVPRSSLWSIFTAILTALGVLFAFRGRVRANGAKAAGAPPEGRP